jgi:hypothetical protein
MYIGVTFSLHYSLGMYLRVNIPGATGNGNRILVWPSGGYWIVLFAAEAQKAQRYLGARALGIGDWWSGGGGKVEYDGEGQMGAWRVSGRGMAWNTGCVT